MKKQNLDPSTPSPAYRAFASDWHLANDLIGGTEVMRAASATYLPPHAREPKDAYAERLSGAVLYPGFTQTLEALASKPFQQPLVLNADVPGFTRRGADNIDGRGGSLDNFARRWFKEALAKGRAYALVDTPRDRGDPSWNLLAAEDVIAAKQEYRDGLEVTTHLRYYEHRLIANGFEETWETTIKEYNLNEAGFVAVRIWVQDRRQRWTVAEEFETELRAIALVEFRAGATPPLRDLMFLNVAHWQSDSDQRAIMRIARMPILAVSGQIGDDGDDEIVIGPHSLLKIPDPNSRAYFVEHSGAAIQAGRQELLDLEDRMAAFGMHFLRRKSGNVTATARALDEASLMAPLESMALSFKAAIELALAYTAFINGDRNELTVGSGGSIEISTSFASFDLGETDLDALSQARKDRDISREAYLRELKRRGVLADDFDTHKDRDALAAEVVQ